MTGIIRSGLPFLHVLLCLTKTDIALAQQGVETRVYRSENERQIKITSVGNLVGLETPGQYEHIDIRGPRQGYAVAYWDPIRRVLRVVHDVFDSKSSTIKQGVPDLVPISFKAPRTGRVFKLNQQVVATAVVETRDRMLRITRNWIWAAGSGVLEEKTIVTNISRIPVPIISIKHTSDVQVDNGRLNITEVPQDANPPFNPRLPFVRRFIPPISIASFCPCIPADCVTWGGDLPTGWSRHFIQWFAEPNPTAAIVSRVDDDLLLAAGSQDEGVLTSAKCGKSTPGRVELEDTEQTLCWSFKGSLKPFRSESVVTLWNVN